MESYCDRVLDSIKEVPKTGNDIAKDTGIKREFVSMALNDVYRMHNTKLGHFIFSGMYCSDYDYFTPIGSIISEVIEAKKSDTGFSFYQKLNGKKQYEARLKAFHILTQNPESNHRERFWHADLYNYTMDRLKEHKDEFKEIINNKI